MATVPTLLYYLSIFLMIEADSRRLGTRTRAGRCDAAVSARSPRATGTTSRRWSAIAVLHVLRHVTAFRAVFWATVLAVALSFVAGENGALAARACVARAAAGRAGRARAWRRPRRRPASSSAS